MQEEEDVQLKGCVGWVWYHYVCGCVVEEAKLRRPCQERKDIMKSALLLGCVWWGLDVI